MDGKNDLDVVEDPVEIEFPKKIIAKHKLRHGSDLASDHLSNYACLMALIKCLGQEPLMKMATIRKNMLSGLNKSTKTPQLKCVQIYPDYTRQYLPITRL